MIDININKTLHGAKGSLLLDIELHINKGEFYALMGVSGSGKTTLLRIIAGLEESRGEIVVDGVLWSTMPAQKREIGFVFQDHALFTNMSVEENLLFVQNDKKLSKELLEITELTHLASRNVVGLSGGQKQRVNLCRALMKRPKILLMDEPFSALDTQMKMNLQKKIKQLHKRFKTTTIMVSHQYSEVITLADRVLILEEGKIVKNVQANKLFENSDNKVQVEVLELIKKNNQIFAKVNLSNQIVEVEVSQQIKLGDFIVLSFNTH